MSGKRKDYISWDEYFMGVAVLSGMRSKDPNTQVGACNECAKAIIQSGIRRIVYDSDKYETTPAVVASKKMLNAAGVVLQRYEHTNRRIELEL